MASRQSCEYRTLHKNFSIVVGNLAATVNPTHFAQKLNEVNLVSKDIVDSASVVGVLTAAQRIQPVITAVHAQIELRASLYHKFIAVVQQFNPLLAEVLGKFHDMLAIMSGITDLKPLGHQLDLDPVKLNELQQGGRSPEQHAEELLVLWQQKDGDPSWEKLARALKRMGEHELARRIGEKHVHNHSDGDCEIQQAMSIPTTGMQFPIYFPHLQQRTPPMPYFPVIPQIPLMPLAPRGAWSLPRFPQGATSSHSSASIDLGPPPVKVQRLETGSNNTNIQLTPQSSVSTGVQDACGHQSSGYTNQSPQLPRRTEPEPSFHDYCECVRKSYQMRSPVRTEFNTWPPVKQTKFINLALLKAEKLAYGDEYTTYTIRGSADDVLAKKEEITYTELFGSAEVSARILVEGRPGSGKTTLVNKVSQEWADNKILKEISLLLLIPLRQFHNKRVIHLTDIIRLFGPKGLNLSVATGISDSGGKGVCIILDGIDEYSYHESPNNFISELMLRKNLPNAMVIATSRPAAAHHLRQHVSKRAEVLGFLRRQINQYIRQCYSESERRTTSLLQYLEQHPNIKHMCYLPLHLAMIVYLNDVLDGNHEALPKTETEVYLRFTTYTLLRHLHRDPQLVPVQKLMTPDDLPRELLELFKNICRLAFEMTVESVQIFSRERIGDVFGGYVQIASLGLVTVDKQFVESGLEETYSFLHLTFQEFLAAYYITGLPDEEQLRLFREQCEHKHMNVVMKFYCGLTKLNGDAPAEVFKTMIGHSNANLLHLLQCTSESRNSKSCCDLVSSRDGTLTVCDESITPSDCAALAFCVNSTSTVLTKIELSACHLDEEEYEVLSSEITGTCAHVKFICLNRTLVRKKAVRCLVQFLHKFPNLQSLEMAKCMSKVHSLTELSLLLEGLTFLTHLSIDVSVAKSFGTRKIFVAAKSLQSLRINGRVLATEITKEPEGSTTLRLLHLRKSTEEVLVTGDSTLSKLSVKHRVNLSESDVAAVVELMKWCCNTLKTIELKKCKISSVGVAALVTALSSKTFLKTLRLQNCGITDDSMVELSQALLQNKTLEELDLSSPYGGNDNEITHVGVSSLSEALLSNKSLKTLNLWGNKLADQGVCSIAEALHGNEMLQSLDLGHNNISDQGATALAQLLETNKAIKTLDLSLNNITDVGILALSAMLPLNKSLQHLELSLEWPGHYVTDEGVRQLASGLEGSTSLKTLKLYSTSHISHETMKILRDSAQRRGIVLNY